MIIAAWRETDEPKQETRRLAKALLEKLGYPDMPLEHDGRGRPFFPGGPGISLSHTAKAAAAAVSDSGPVGIDIEGIRPVRPGLARRVMSREELLWYQDRGERPEDFFRLWTLKESYYKYLGTGLPGFPNGTSFHLEGGLWRQGEEPLWFRTGEKDLLLLSVCGEAQEISFF